MEKLIRLIVLGVVSILIIGCSHTIKRSEKPQPVSLIELLAHPERNNGRLVSVIGYYHHEMESSAVYLSRDDARFAVHRNSVFLGRPSPNPVKIEKFNDTYALVEGRFVFDPSGEGHFNLWPSAIHDITLIVPSKELAVGE